MISRRHFIALAGAASATVVVATNPASATPIVLADAGIRRYGPVMLIGDSLSGGYIGGLKTDLVARGVGPFRCDIQGSRSITRDSKKFPSGVSAVRSARKAGFDPHVWVIALGGNDLWFFGRDPAKAQEMVDTILREIGADRIVYFVNMWQVKSGSSFPILNRALASAPQRWPRLHIADWASVASRHPEWHGHDGTHYNAKGAVQRNAFLVRTMIDASTASAIQALSRSTRRSATYVM